MYENQDMRYQHPKPDSKLRLKDMMGLLVLGAGLAITGWVFYQVFLLISKPVSVAVISDLAARGSQVLTLILPGGRGESMQLSMPPGIMGYGMAFLLLVIAAGLAKSLVSAGASLLQGNTDVIAARINEAARKMASAKPGEKTNNI